MQPGYFMVHELLYFVDEPHRTPCFKILNDNQILFEMVQGSTHNHQAWPGGYLDHVQEIMNIVKALYKTYNALRPLPFSLSDALLIVFLHDIEKPWKYEVGADGQLQHNAQFQTKAAEHEFRDRKLVEYGIVLTPDQANALWYVEGENKDYSSRRRVMNPLAALCHLADVTSARIWFDHPLEQNDSWSGAKRIRT